MLRRSKKFSWPLEAVIRLAIGVVVILLTLFPRPFANDSVLAETTEPVVPAAGAAAVELQADDTMVIAGGIHPRFVQGQEGQLRATAFVLAGPRGRKVAFVSCDVLMITKDLLEPSLERIKKEVGIPREAVLVAPTHTHHAPSTVRVHGYGPDEKFCRQLQDAIAEAVIQAARNMEPVSVYFAMGAEKTIGQNSRLLLADGTIYWIGPRNDAVRPTGPVDVDLPVLIFRRTDGSMKGFLFAHATHAIGAVSGNVRSPTFYGLGAQALEKEWGAVGAYFPGPCGSTHRLDVPPKIAQDRIMEAIREAVAQAKPWQIEPLRYERREFRFRVRHFSEEAEQKAVEDYCRKRAGESADAIIQVFRQMRRELAPLQGQERTTEIQAIRMGDLCWVGVPAELFPSLGLEMKRRSPFPVTYVIELANDWIGYVPDLEGFDLGGYQVWTGFHSYVERGTGERLVDEVVSLLNQLAAEAAPAK
ncbi:MAG: hypothetical protein NZ899_03580 [Thermoguttaceae bacterium]|nr:hypothetical protein [Thermoguttaceae bacterium]MDW8078802.1 hypothetical protein [Thermoguttaceae bacterium]